MTTIVSPTAVQLSDVRLTLDSQAGPVKILNGIDLSVARGEAVGLVGPSGSGKSTLLMVLAGLEKASSGTVRVAGHDFANLGEDALAEVRRKHIGIVFQSFHLIPTMTALENVAVPMELSNIRDAFDRAAAELKSVGLGHRMDHYPSQLSGGEQQRTALARALAPQPDILLADEPTGNLDGKTGEAIVELMFQLRLQRKATLILITHDEHLAHRCERVIRLRDGLVERIEEGRAPAQLRVVAGKDVQ